MKQITLIFVSVLLLSTTHGQSLDELVNDETTDKQDEAIDLFRGNRLVNGHATKFTTEGELILFIAHRFGKLNGGFYELFGLDQASMRFGFDYGVSDQFNLGFGRSTIHKTYDLYAKLKFVQATAQSPFDIVAIGGYSVSTLRNFFPGGSDGLADRSTFWGQLLLATQLNDVSFQLMPTALNSGYVPGLGDSHTNFALGAGASAKISKRVSLNAEYYYQISNDFPDASSPLSFGIDVETGGHLFQLTISNTQAMFEKGFISENTGNWGDGEIYFGFNLIRVFNIK